MTVVARLELKQLQPERELSDLLHHVGNSGAVVSFVGVARPHSRSGEDLRELILDHHPGLTRQSLEDIAVAAAQRFGVNDVRVVHRCGTVPAGEPIVFAAAAAVHRRAAFEAADYLMDRLKTDAVFWKKEVGTSGSEWIEPTEADYSDRERWG